MSAAALIAHSFFACFAGASHADRVGIACRCSRAEATRPLKKPGIRTFVLFTLVLFASVSAFTRSTNPHITLSSMVSEDGILVVD
jgi:hypothetical protein